MAGYIALGTFLHFVIVFVSVQCIDIDFDDSEDGFFLKSPYHKFKPAEPSVVKESLILTHPSEVYKLRASYGPFEMYQVVPNNILSKLLKHDETFAQPGNYMQRQIIHNMDVSAHLVSPTVVRTNPVVQVLVHAQPLTRRRKQDLIYSYYGYSQHWCAQVFARKGGEQYSAVCVLSGDSNACVAGISVPDHWWDSVSNSSQLGEGVRVLYDISRVEQNQECASVSNTIIPARPEVADSEDKMKFISTVQLAQEGLLYEDYKDKDLVFRIPQSDLKSNSRFEVPVMLEKNSALKEFTIQVKVRGGIEIEGASTGVDSEWSVIFEAGDIDGTATVTAFMKEEVKHKSFSQEEIMRWQFRVSPGPSTLTTARIVWIVDYERNGLLRNSYFSPEGTKVSAKFNILGGQSENIVAVLKEQSILNTAILTGEPVIHDLLVYTVSSDNSFRDATKDSICRSTDPEALKVSDSCDHILLDGSELHGAKNVTVIVRTAEHMAQIGVRVWVPEPRLDIQLSDPKLSQVRGWKVQKKTSSVSKRSLDFSALTGSVKPDNSQNRQTCRYKYQQSKIDVYARFVIIPPSEAPRYFRNKKTFVRVTSLVQDRLQVANENIAKMVGVTVQGVAPGRTEVQVVSPRGKLLGAKEVRVGKDKVEIERLMVRVITGMSLHITEDRNLPGALMATVFLRDQLVAKQQEAVLDIAVEFKDGSMLPLSDIDPSEFDLKVTSMNPDVVEVTEYISTVPALPPSIKAVGNGKGEIVKVILRETDLCQRKKIRTLDTEYVHVQVDFAKDLDFFNLVQSDGYYYSNRAGDRRQGGYGRDVYQNKEEYFKHQQQQYNKQRQQVNEDISAKSAKADPKVHPLDTLDKLYDKIETMTLSPEDSDTTEQSEEALEQPMSTEAKHPNPLEIGMYVLVAVFIFAILVFTANCAVFMVRYQRKRSPKGSSRVTTGSISQAPDWVWIGRATLERHGAGNAGCNHALMAEEDFNGNQMLLPNSLSSSVSSRSSRGPGLSRPPDARSGKDSNPRVSSTSGVTGSASTSSNRDSMVSTYQGSECSIRITANPLPDEDNGMGYNEAEWDYEAMGMTYEQLMDYFDNLKESSA